MPANAAAIVAVKVKIVFIRRAEGRDEETVLDVFVLEAWITASWGSTFETRGRLETNSLLAVVRVEWSGRAGRGCHGSRRPKLFRVSAIAASLLVFIEEIVQTAAA